MLQLVTCYVAEKVFRKKRGDEVRDRNSWNCAHWLGRQGSWLREERRRKKGGGREKKKRVGEKKKGEGGGEGRGRARPKQGRQAGRVVRGKRGSKL